MINTVANAKNDVKEIVLNALGRLVAEGRLAETNSTSTLFPFPSSVFP